MDLAVLTRDEVEPYAPLFAAIGLEVIAMPVTHGAAPADRTALPRALAAGGYAVIVVASPRAVTELAHARDEALVTLPEVWAVGPSTKRALDIARIKSVHPSDVTNGAELAERLVATRSLAGQRVLVPRAEEGREDAIRILRAAGAEVDDVIAYRTVPTRADDPRLARGREALGGGAAKVCAVFAPSQVVALDSLVGPLTGLVCRFAAIGATTAAALRERGVTSIAVASTPTPEGLAAALR